MRSKVSGFQFFLSQCFEFKINLIELIRFYAFQHLNFAWNINQNKNFMSSMTSCRPKVYFQVIGYSLIWRITSFVWFPHMQFPSNIHDQKQIEHFVTVMATKLKNELFSNVFAGCWEVFDQNSRAKWEWHKAAGLVNLERPTDRTADERASEMISM